MLKRKQKGQALLALYNNEDTIQKEFLNKLVKDINIPLDRRSINRIILEMNKVNLECQAHISSNYNGTNETRDMLCAQVDDLCQAVKNNLERAFGSRELIIFQAELRLYDANNVGVNVFTCEEFNMRAERNFVNAYTEWIKQLGVQSIEGHMKEKYGKSNPFAMLPLFGTLMEEYTQKLCQKHSELSCAPNSESSSNIMDGMAGEMYTSLPNATVPSAPPLFLFDDDPYESTQKSYHNTSSSNRLYPDLSKELEASVYPITAHVRCAENNIHTKLETTIPLGSDKAKNEDVHTYNHVSHDGKTSNNIYPNLTQELEKLKNPVTDSKLGSIIGTNKAKSFIEWAKENPIKGCVLALVATPILLPVLCLLAIYDMLNNNYSNVPQTQNDGVVVQGCQTQFTIL